MSRPAALSPKDRLIQDLEMIFTRAMESENLSVALKAKEILAKIQGLVPNSGTAASQKTRARSLSSLSEEELRTLLLELEETS